MRFMVLCEKEGCTKTAKKLVIDWALGWIWSMCLEHEAEKPQEHTSCDIPFQPPPP
jgi:hypothetical protein